MYTSKYNRREVGTKKHTDFNKGTDKEEIEKPEREKAD